MEKLDGTILRRDLPWPLTADEASTLCARRARRAGRAALGRRRGEPGAGPARPRRRVRRRARSAAGSDRFARARTDDTGDWSDIVAWIEAHQPARRRAAPDPQRLPLRQPGARARRPAADRGGARLGDGHRRRPADGSRRDAVLLGRGRRRRVLPDVPPPAHDRAGHVDPRPVRGALLRADGLRGDPRAVALLRGLRAVPARGDRPADLVPLLPPADHQRGVRRVRSGRGLSRDAVPVPAGDRLDRRGP